MKVILVLTAVISASVALPAAPAAPATSDPPPNWRPSGRLLLLPLVEQPKPNNTQTPKETQSSRLLDSGEYYVLLPDGRLQMVKYMTAAILETPEGEDTQEPVPEAYRYTAPSPEFSSEDPAPLQVQYIQFPHPGSQFAQTKLELAAKEEEKKGDLKEEKEEESGFQANVQFRDVKPITAPIYAYNPSPLVRIVRDTQ